MKAIILGAGQGKRLLPLTSDRPKNTIEIAGRTMLAWQVEQFVRCGIDEIVVVTGFKAEVQDREVDLLRKQYPGCRFETIFNPFYKVADNLVSCWMAGSRMDDEFVLVNGDTLFHENVLRRLMSSRGAPITLAIDKKERYDEDDMKVHLDGAQLLEIGKDLPTDRINGESIGMLFFRDQGPRIFREMLSRIMSADGALDIWYLSAIGAIAQEHVVLTQTVQGLGWCEVDFPVDKTRAEDLVMEWTRRAVAH
jgi:choline kinase